MNRTRVFVATSLDGFIAGPNDDLDWLPGPESGIDTFAAFIAEIGALLMGRRTYEVASQFEGGWPYGKLPVLVATTRPFTDAGRPPPETVRRVTGNIRDLVTEAKTAAGDRDVYLDGGVLIRSALDAHLVDEMTLTVIPVILGRGIPLFSGVENRLPLSLVSQRTVGAGAVELRYRLPPL